MPGTGSPVAELRVVAARDPAAFRGRLLVVPILDGTVSLRPLLALW